MFSRWNISNSELYLLGKLYKETYEEDKNCSKSKRNTYSTLHKNYRDKSNEHKMTLTEEKEKTHTHIMSCLYHEKGSRTGTRISKLYKKYFKVKKKPSILSSNA